MRRHYFPSKNLIKLAYKFNDPRFFSHPEETLGLEWEEILKFWLLIDDLTQDQWKVVKNRFCKWSYDNPTWIYYRTISDWIDNKGFINFNRIVPIHKNLCGIYGLLEPVFDKSVQNLFDNL